MLRMLNAAASRLAALPGLSIVSPSAAVYSEAEDLEGYRRCQELAQRGVAEISGLIQEGWTEQQAARLLNTWLRDNGVKSFFHEAFVWYGERTRFDGVKTYWDFLPSNRVVLPGEAYILDVAPIYQGYICDIGFTAALGKNAQLVQANKFLDELKDEIPHLFEMAGRGSDIWRAIDERIKEAGYDSIHKMYPFSVLGHRVHRMKQMAPDFSLINFGWQAYWAMLSRGVFGQLLNENFQGDLKGLWAIEPHIGTRAEGTAHFGAKFEEILVFDEDGARWLAEV